MRDETHPISGRLQRLGHALADGIFGTVGLLSLAWPRRSARLVCTCPPARPPGALLGDVSGALHALGDERICEHRHR